MEELHPRCAGIDIGKKYAKVCVRGPGADPGGRRKADRVSEVVTTWGSMTNQILALREHLVAERVTCVVMEATGDYWKPYFYLLEDLPGCEVMLVNARHVKNVPGRKSDVNDATWLAQLGAHGLVRASFVPPPPIRELRDLTRTRTAVTRERSREVLRLEKLLEGAGIKLSSVVSDLSGVSSRRMLLALADGERDPQRLAGLAHWSMRGKTGALVQALTGQFTEHHGFLVRTHFDLIDKHDQVIAELTARIEVVIEPFRGFRDLICSIPGISTLVADVVTAETGADMTRFATAARLASWAGVCPGINESAGKVKSTKTRHGNNHLKGALGIAALAAIGTKDTYYAARYQRLKTRRGAKRALVAIQHDMLVAIWHMAQTGELYNDPGGDYYQRLQPDRARRHAIAQLQRLGYEVTLAQAS
ncbi:IS110 family transposase [Nocardioides sp.]|uniref:IS110 family transposase n=1 Tax=Nocardioides sp. TaxID=35761 RepID=UPI002735CC98|nr:IS110 family transposase [Nocardioides sp.]MDP3890648.1 IS110 family transposase [Nocardioides sp.]